MSHPRAEADLLREYLADRDVACAACRYNLRGTPGDVCPECGAQLRIRVQPWVRFPPSYMMGVIGNIAGMTASAVTGALGATYSLPRLVLMGSGFVASLLFQIMWDRSYRFARRRRGISPWSLVALTWIVPAGAAAILVLWLGRL